MYNVVYEPLDDEFEDTRDPTVCDGTCLSSLNYTVIQITTKELSQEKNFGTTWVLYPSTSIRDVFYSRFSEDILSRINNYPIWRQTVFPYTTFTESVNTHHRVDPKTPISKLIKQSLIIYVDQSNILNLFVDYALYRTPPLCQCSVGK